MKNSSSDGFTIAIIGTGEMGTAIGRRLREHGARVITSLQGRSSASARRVAEAGISLAADSDDLVGSATFVLSIVPPGVAVEVARLIAPSLHRAAASDPIYVDCNAVSPTTVRKIAELIEPTGRRFIDASIIGGPPSSAVNISASDPRIYSSGPEAAALVRLRNFGLEIVDIGGAIGAASGLKMCYAALSKGLTALGAIVIEAAEREGLSDCLRAELEHSAPLVLQWLSRRVPDMLPKAYRWVAEMEEIADFLGADRPGGQIFEGTAALYRQVSDDYGRNGTDSRIAALVREFLKIEQA
jgi:3-hydroxyisobutyrate dehydrogenase-like beta-hydroxyacid dehydrogenase